MLTSLEIKNFRCFHHTKTKGFSKINLFGGKNNAGKTVLLEALLLLNEPINKNIGLLLQFRRLDVEFIKKIPTRAWDNFFYQKKKKNVEIVISTKNEKNESQKVTLHCNESTEHFTSLAQNTDENDEDLQHFIRNISKRETVKSVLHINAFKEDEKVSTNTFVASNRGVLGKGENYISYRYRRIDGRTK